MNTCTRHNNASCYSFTFLYATGAGTSRAEATAAMVNRTMAIGVEATGAGTTGAVATGTGATGSGATGSRARNA